MVELLLSPSSFKVSSVFDRPLFVAKLLLPEISQVLSTFIGSRADANIIDKELAHQLGIGLSPLPCSVPARALDSHLLGTVTHQTIPVRLLMSGNHHETIQFYALLSPRLPLILGYPWLCRHNPHIDWSAGVIRGWSSACHQVCLKQAAALLCSPPPCGQPGLSGVPVQYHDLCEVFSKAMAMSLPPHRPYDCAIDLLPGTPPQGAPLLPFWPWKGGHGGLHQGLLGSWYHSTIFIPCWRWPDLTSITETSMT